MKCVCLCLIYFSSILQVCYVEIRILRNISDSPLYFEITRVNCILLFFFFCFLFFRFFFFVFFFFFLFFFGLSILAIIALYLVIVCSLALFLCVSQEDLHENIPVILNPLNPKLGFTWVYIIFHISVRNIDCWDFFEPSRRGGPNMYPPPMF